MRDHISFDPERTTNSPVERTLNLLDPLDSSTSGSGFERHPARSILSEEALALIGVSPALNFERAKEILSPVGAPEFHLNFAELNPRDQWVVSRLRGMGEITEPMFEAVVKDSHHVMALRRYCEKNRDVLDLYGGDSHGSEKPLD